ncbi:MBL fold metallo-hydrolase [Aeromicrobium sp. UC242_57]|uniref:MBL fold metallo-hydrolase n=1 Tax=Aeromicrobium sp. UC242_57 TaxID=3374624 RepID=UPI00379476A5
MSALSNDGKIVDLAHGNYAYLQEGGSWGWSNAGLVTSDGVSLLVDTLFDVRLTDAMLQAFRATTPAARHIEALVNTHNDGDHTHGNQLLTGSRIIASKAAAEAMVDGVKPADFEAMLAGAANLGDLGRFLVENFGPPFHFGGIEYVLPTETFSGETTVTVGSKQVQLIEVGPAHTPGDVIAYVESDRTVFTGDILFNGSHPVIWAGPITNWIDACDRIIGWNPEVIVPGHGPMATLDSVRELRAYFEYLIEIGRESRDAGLTPWQAARKAQAEERWINWGESERLVVNFASVYEYLGDEPYFPVALEGLREMARFAYSHDARTQDAHSQDKVEEIA